MSLRNDLLGQIADLNQRLNDKTYEVAQLEERLRQAYRDNNQRGREIAELRDELTDARRLPTSGDMRGMQLRHEAAMTELHAHYARTIEELRDQLSRQGLATAEVVGQLGAAEQENAALLTRVTTIHALTCPDCWPDSVTIDTPLCAVHAPQQSVPFPPPSYVQNDEATNRVRDALGSN